MAGTSHSIELDASEAIAELGQLLSRISDGRPFFVKIGTYLTDEAIPDRFRRETSPDGVTWARLSQTTIDRRQAKGQVPIRILQAGGSAAGLLASITFRATVDELRVGTPAVYAAVHQFGARKGAFGTDAKGRPLPWGDIPARPFLGLSNEDQREIAAIARRWLDPKG